jgi:NDP-mannose synthase
MRVVILAGGKGTRLAPYTLTFPKPLMPLGSIPILEVVIRQLKHHGYKEITLAVGHLSELLEAYFKDGKKLGVRIDYSKEKHPLGTAGPLTLISGLNEPFLVMNGDILTDLNYQDLFAYHLEKGAAATIATYNRSVQIDLGVIEKDDRYTITNYHEKPTYHFDISMGVYVFSPLVLNYIPRAEPFDFPDLVLRLLSAGEMVLSYPFSGYWLDIGRPDDYAQACEIFEHNHKLFLPGE